VLVLYSTLNALDTFVGCLAWNTPLFRPSRAVFWYLCSVGLLVFGLCAHILMRIDSAHRAVYLRLAIIALLLGWTIAGTHWYRTSVRLTLSCPLSAVLI
jgi:hypothetical protein